MNLKKSVFNFLFVTIFASSVFANQSETQKNSVRINPSISYGKNIKFLNGALENYDPVRARFGFEFNNGDDFWFFNRYTFTPFFGRIHEAYDVGFDFGLKKIFLEGNKINPFTHVSVGGIYLDKKLKEHKRRGNFHFNSEMGLEIELWKDFALTSSVGYEHVSGAKKLKNNIIHRTTKGDNTGNPGLNFVYGSVGVIYNF